MPDVGPDGVQVCVPLGPLVRTGQVVVTQPLLEVAALGVHDEMGTSFVLFEVQVVVTQLLATVPAEAEHV